MSHKEHRSARVPGAVSAVRRKLAAMGRRPRKRLGQHFLIDARVAAQIVDVAGLRSGDKVVEIGPGLGALSELVVERAAETWLIEMDHDFAERLRAKYAATPRVHVVEADVLGVDFAALLGAHAPVVLIANLPYNIGTAVLSAALQQSETFSRMVLMLQREVVERLVAAPGSKVYGALSVLTQYSARVHDVLRVPPQAFMPPPKVESDVILVEPWGTPPVSVLDAKIFRNVVKTVFTQRRKQLVNGMRPLCTDSVAVLGAAGIDPTRRPETLSLAEFAALANALKQRADRTELRQPPLS